MTSPAGNTPGKALTRNAGVALAICLSATLALLPSHASAQDRSPSPEGLWKKYPLAPTAEPSAGPEVTATPTADTSAGRRPVAASSDDGTPVIVLVLLGLIGAGGALTVVSVRRRRESEPKAATTPPPPTAVEAPTLWHGSSGRFSRAVTRSTATIAAPERGGGSPRAAADPPRQQAGESSGTANDPPRPSAAAARAADRPSPVTPVAAAASTGSPPDRRLAWTAEIEWREIDDESRFYVIARGAGTVVVAQSAPLEWPPSGPAAVKAVRSAADELADMLAAAGWKTLPPGHSWYAKRFAWEPGATPAKSGCTPVKPGPTPATSGSTPAKRGPKPVAAPSPATTSRAPGGAGAAPDRAGGMRAPRWKLLALLCVVGVLGLVAALQLVGGSDDPPAGATSAPNAQASDRTDLSVPLLVLLGVPLIVVIVRQTRRARSAGSRKL